MKHFIFILIAVVFISCKHKSKETTTNTEIITPDDNPVINDSTAVDMNKQAGSEAAGKNIIYTCPVHPEVQSDKPGKCPRCGRKLVLKK